MFRVIFLIFRGNFRLQNPNTQFDRIKREIKDTLAVLKTSVESHGERRKKSAKERKRKTILFPWQLQPGDGA